MKKNIVLIMAMTMALSMAACGGNAGNTSAETTVNVETTANAETTANSETTANTTNAESTVASSEGVTEQKPETVTIQAYSANSELIDVEVPYDPQRIAILDMAALDIVDCLGLGDRVVGSASISIDYLKDYNPDDSNGTIVNLGNVKTADLEKVALCEPDVIFIGGRLSKIYADLEAIAPVVFLGVDYEKGVVESTRDNAKTIASMFGKEAEVDALFDGFQPRIEALNAVLSGHEVLLGMYNSNALGLMDTNSQLNIIARELGATNLGETVGSESKPTHGDEASWETIIKLDPEYMFILDRSSAIGASDEGLLGAKEVIENDLIKELDVYKDGKIVYLAHANVWYTSTGGVQALDTMLADLENALLK